jgi:hypothetical protein
MARKPRPRRNRKAKGKGRAAGVITIDCNAEEIADRLAKGWKHFSELEMRGVISQAVNTIRDVARTNAQAVGLGATGVRKYAGGQTHQLRGLIPSKIFSWVEPNKGSLRQGEVTIDMSGKRGPSQTYHAFFVEFGTSRQAPRPFFVRSLAEASGAAAAAAAKRWAEGVGRIMA